MEREHRTRAENSYKDAVVQHGLAPAPYGRAPWDQVEAAEACLALRTAIEEGNGGKVLDAVAFCAEAGLVLPHWLAAQFLQRYDAVNQGETRDWSDKKAFGKAYKKGTNIAGVRAFHRHASNAYFAAVELLGADLEQAVDVSLYEAVGKRLEIGQTRAYELIEQFLQLTGDTFPPIAEMRAKLKAGKSIEGAIADWRREKSEAKFGQISLGK